ncbi:hypothetical protein J3E69DRAFT_333667 [Trichoderma sp. SZMC 28015]
MPVFDMLLRCRNRPPQPLISFISFIPLRRTNGLKNIHFHGMAQLHLELLTRAGLCILFPSHDFDSGLLPLFLVYRSPWGL